MAYFVSTPPVAGAIDEVHSSQLNALLSEATDNLGNVYVYLKGVANVVAGSWVSYDENGVTALVDTDTAATCRGPVAVAQAAVDSTSEYGWFMVKGSTSAAAISGGGAADNANVFATSTAGSVDDVPVADCQVTGAVFRSAESSGAATVQLNRPWIGVDEAA